MMVQSEICNYYLQGGLCEVMNGGRYFLPQTMSSVFDLITALCA